MSCSKTDGHLLRWRENWQLRASVNFNGRRLCFAPSLCHYFSALKTLATRGGSYMFRTHTCGWRVSRQPSRASAWTLNGRWRVPPPMWWGAHEARLFRVWWCGRRRISPRFRRRRCAPASRREGWWALPGYLPLRRICAVEHALKGTARHTPPYPCPGLWGMVGESVPWRLSVCCTFVEEEVTHAFLKIGMPLMTSGYRNRYLQWNEM